MLYSQRYSLPSQPTVPRMFSVVEDGRLPEYQTICSAAADCYARVYHDIHIGPKQVARVPLGFRFDQSSYDYAALLLPRSGWSLQGITLANSPGTIDPDFKEEICALITNNSDKNFWFPSGSRVCQVLLTPIYKWDGFKTIQQERQGGYGSTNP